MLLILRGMLLTAQHFSSSKISPRRGSSSVTRPSGVKKAPFVKMILCVCKNSSQNRASLMLFPSNQTGIPTSCVLRSEEHTSELQSRFDLVCRLLLEKKKKT